MIAYKLVEGSTGRAIGVRLKLDNTGVYADTTADCFKKLCETKGDSFKKGKDVEVHRQGDTFVSSGNEALVLEVQDIGLLDKLYCGEVKNTICVSGLNASTTRDAHKKICNIISSVNKFSGMMFVYISDKYSAQLKVDIHFKIMEDLVDFALSYYGKKYDKINIGSKKYPLSKEALMSIPKDKFVSIGDFSTELEDEEDGVGYITGFFKLEDSGYLLD